MKSPAAAVIAALAIYFSDTPVFAACQLAPQGEGRVVSIIDGRTFRLDDGRDIRLSGVETNVAGIDIDASKAALASLILNRDVLLQGDADKPDRYGREHAVVVVTGLDKSIQSELLSRGSVLMALAVPDQACAQEWKAAEKEGRLGKRGLWGDGFVTKKAEMAGDILANVGRMAVIEGRVRSARQSGATFYVNFGRRWTQDFAVTISRRMMPTLEASGIDLKTLEGKRVRVRGWVEKRGGPRIDIAHVSQFEVVD